MTCFYLIEIQYVHYIQSEFHPPPPVFLNSIHATIDCSENSRRSRSLRQKTKNWVNTAITFVALIIALLLLYDRLRTVRLEELINHLKTLEPGRLFLIFASTGLSYWILTGFDWVALRFLRKPIPYRQIAVAAFVGYSLSKNLGLSWLTGGSLRYRFYSRFGITLTDVAKLMLFNTTTFLCGFFFWGGLSFLAFPFKSGPSVYLSDFTIRLIGIGLLALPSLYLTFSFLGWKTVSFRSRKGRIPPAKVVLLQMTLGVLDVFFTIWILYLFLPADSVALTSFFGIFFTGELLSILSHAPGGLGVFETVMFQMLKDFFPEVVLLYSLLLYRVIYFLVPLAFGITLLVIDELNLRKRLVVTSVLHPEKKSR
jgi:uncharacterized membrane protein YbhN (UPF0104 family)